MMMGRKRALTLPFDLDKDKLMENPLRIPSSYLECGKIQQQISWTAITGHKSRRRDSKHKNGAVLFDHNHAAMVRLGLSERKPCLILTDVLKTDAGKAYMEKIKRHVNGKEKGLAKDLPMMTRDRLSSQKKNINSRSKSLSPRRRQTSISSFYNSRSRSARKAQKKKQENGKDKNDVASVKNEFELVDCGLSVRWEQENHRNSSSAKDKKTEPKKGSQKRKLHHIESECTQTDTPKRPRTSVLRLSGVVDMEKVTFCQEDAEEEDAEEKDVEEKDVEEEDAEEKDAEQKDAEEKDAEEEDAEEEDAEEEDAEEERAEELNTEDLNAEVEKKAEEVKKAEEDKKAGEEKKAEEEKKAGEDKAEEEKEDDKDLKNADGGILQFTVGGDDGTAEPIDPLSQDNGVTTPITEPIVLSSDDEDSNEKGLNKSIGPKQISEMLLSPQQKPDLDLQAFQVIVNDHSDSVQDTCICLAFYNLHCGPYQAKANGDLLITDENIILPLKDDRGEMDLMITLERRQLRRYSVWEKKELEALKYFSNKSASEIPAAGLLCCVSEHAAEGLQYDLIELCDKPDSPITTGKPSPFILIFLEESLEGMEGAFLRSLLDIDCLNSLTQHKTLEEYDQGISGPFLSLDQSIELIKSSELDPHLLQLLDQGSDYPDADYEQESFSNCDLDSEMPKETALELEKTPECEIPQCEIPECSQAEEAEQHKETSNVPSAKNFTEPVYTLCHRRLEDSYSVTMCQPDSSWVRYKHQGLARRLIQFPPPPMKGGITVTMEDLQCLDIGQYLNDVIIDFYLKYLLQNASESAARRSHIFSSFFYKQLTRRDNASEGSNSESCQRQKRYQRVRTWTRHVDIFSKDFIFVPVNQEAHWYLVVICFPGLEEPKTESLSPDEDETQASELSNENPALKSDATDTEKEDTANDSGPGSVICTEQTCRRRTVCKRPCILVMDSLKRSPHERVFKLIREYLQSEWESRRGSSREFGPDQMESSHCQVPLQDNSSDCGLYVLHYVESFLKDPIVHFDLPLHLKFWFPRHQVRRKREEIRDLVLKLYRIQNMNVTT